MATRAVAWQGYAEADFVKVGPTQQGLVTAVLVGRGDRVVKNQPLFEQDNADDSSAVAQAEFLSQQARDQLENLRDPGKPTEIAQAEANLRDAQAARDKAASDLERNQSLVKSGAATAQLVDEEQDDLRSAVAKISAMRALVNGWVCRNSMIFALGPAEPPRRPIVSKNVAIAAGSKPEAAMTPMPTRSASYSLSRL